MTRPSRSSAPRRMAHALRQSFERSLHPRRRAHAFRVLRALPPARSVLVVCRGNICRSPFGAQYLERLLRDASPALRVVSGGFLGPGRRPPPDAMRAAMELGVDLSWHLSRTLDAHMMRNADVVLVMEPVQARVLARGYPDRRSHILHLGDFDPAPIDRRAIEDPYSKDLEAFRACYRRIARCLDGVLSGLQPGSTGAPDAAGSSRSTSIRRPAID